MNENEIKSFSKDAIVYFDYRNNVRTWKLVLEFCKNWSFLKNYLLVIRIWKFCQCPKFKVISFFDFPNVLSSLPQTQFLFRFFLWFGKGGRFEIGSVYAGASGKLNGVGGERFVFGFASHLPPRIDRLVIGASRTFLPPVFFISAQFLKNWLTILNVTFFWKCYQLVFSRLVNSRLMSLHQKYKFLGFKKNLRFDADLMKNSETIYNRFYWFINLKGEN